MTTEEFKNLCETSTPKKVTYINDTSITIEFRNKTIVDISSWEDFIIETHAEIEEQQRKQKEDREEKIRIDKINKQITEDALKHIPEEQREMFKKIHNIK